MFPFILPKIKPRWNFSKNHWKMQFSFSFQIDLQNRSLGAFPYLVILFVNGIYNLVWWISEISRGSDNREFKWKMSSLLNVFRQKKGVDERLICALLWLAASNLWAESTHIFYTDYWPPLRRLWKEILGSHFISAAITYC